VKKKRRLRCSILGTGKVRIAKIDGKEIRIVECITSVDKVFLEDRLEEAEEGDE
jgi:hypothetical protein